MARREFQFVEGTTQKFWAVSHNDTTLTIQFGKVGTAGQTQIKTFDSATAALAAADKLINEKTRKGYQESTGVAPPPPPPAAAPSPAVAVTAAPPLTVPPPTAPAPLVATAERRLNLTPGDWQRACGRASTTDPLPPLATPRPFDLPALKQQARHYIQGHSQTVPFDPNVPVTAEEARFWLHVCATLYQYDFDRRETSLRKLTATPLSKPLDLAEVKAAGAKMLFWQCNLPTIQLQRWWMDPADLVEVFACHEMVLFAAETASAMADWLEAEVYPRLDAPTMDTVRARLRSLWQGDNRDVALAAAVLARHAGVDAELQTFLTRMKKATIPPAKVADGWASAFFGIKDATLLVSEFRRLGLRLCTPADARVWLALTGHSALDVLRDSILATRKSRDMLALLDVLLLAESPEAAVTVLEVKLQDKVPEVGPRCTAWLRAHQAHAVAGLTPLSIDSSTLGEAARAFLAELAPPPAGAPVAATTPVSDANWLRTALDATKAASRLPGFINPATLPPVHNLPAADIQRILTAFAASTLAGPHPLVAALRRHGDRPALAAFAWAVFEGWLAGGAPSKEKWALLALGHLGDDDVVLKLTPLIRAWPGESQHQRAVTGLEVLRTIGTDSALMQLNGMALKLKFKALQERARALMDAIATDRGLSREQLEDRIVPDLGLDANGERVFDFGPRQFRCTLGADLSPVVSDETGKALKDLPKPGVKDDATKATEAIAAWKGFKTQLRAALKIQVMRLEEAMITGRSWTAEEFQTLLVRHPLLQHLVRRLVWEGTALFRVADGGMAVSHDGTPVPLTGVPAIRIAHRLRLTPAQLQAWQAALTATQLEQPFSQLERPVFAPAAAQATKTELTCPRTTIPAARVRNTLEERGWRRQMHDQGGITGFCKGYPSAGVSALVVVDPCILIGMPDNDDVRIEQALFVAGANHPHGPCSEDFHRQLPWLQLGTVDPIAYSETIRDLTSILPTGQW